VTQSTNWAGVNISIPSTTRVIKAEALEMIRTNISQHGCHTYFVRPAPSPKFAYTIGLSETTIGAELILAGGAYYSRHQVSEILNRLALILKETPDGVQTNHALGELGNFSLRDVNPTWSSELTLGALDYYKPAAVRVLQVVPDDQHRTIDVPDLSQVRNETAEPIWQWLDKAWDYPIPENLMVITDIGALRGAPILEANRWEEDAWELFSISSHEFDKENGRAIPFGTLVAVDPTLVLATELDVGEGIWRNPEDLEWKITRLPGFK